MESGRCGWEIKGWMAVSVDWGSGETLGETLVDVGVCGGV